MEVLTFTRNEEPTLGVEVELGIVDGKSLALTSGFDQLVAQLPDDLKKVIKPELFRSTVEINTGVCRKVGEAERDLRRQLAGVESAAQKAGLGLLWTASHPFSHWYDQEITADDRYADIIETLQDGGRQAVTCGLHVHVGVDSGDKAIMICERLMQHLPILLALSSNSPFWDNRLTGLHSRRSMIMNDLPTAGLPPLMRNWSEYVWLVNHSIDGGYIKTIREIWWDVRPHNNFGTVEIRMCDLPPTLEDVLGLASLMQCLVVELSEAIDQGTYQHDCHPIIVRQNKWSAARYGLDATLVHPFTGNRQPARKIVQQLVESCRPYGEKLDCERYLDHVDEMAKLPNGSARQIEIFKETGSSFEVAKAFSKAQTLVEAAV